MGRVSDKLLHLVRHGEVHNPDLVLYGRIPGFRLSELGHRMAEAAALELAGSDRIVSKLYASPLERAQQSARPISSALGLEIETEEGIVEPWNFFEGKVNSGPDAAFKKPRYWHKFWNPFRPSWGEPYRQVATRVRRAMAISVPVTCAIPRPTSPRRAPCWAMTRNSTSCRAWKSPCPGTSSFCADRGVQVRRMAGGLT